MRVALIHDWLDTWGGGEAVLAELLRIFPGADVYTLVDFLEPALPQRRSTAFPARGAGSVTPRCCGHN